MALTGMTGFARLEGGLSGRTWAWETRSVNGKGLDVRVRLPQGLEPLEPLVRESAARRFRRGSLQVALTITRDMEAAPPATLDLALVETLLRAGEPFIQGGRVAPPRWDALLQIRGVLVSERTTAGEPEDVVAALQSDLELVLDRLVSSRDGEGRALAALLEAAIARIEMHVQKAEGEAAAAPEALAQRLLERVRLLAGEPGIDPQRLAQEAALLASKADVREELDRLRAHAAEARRLLAGGDQTGRKLEFLVQELNREANTLCSKSSELALTRIGLDLKAAIDQLREQSANVE